MIKAELLDKPLIVEILSAAFDSNKSVNYIIPQNKARKSRIKKLMEYSFDVCHAYGETVLSDDRKACALILFPENKKTTLNSILWDIKFVISCIGIRGIKKVLDRESKIKSFHPANSFYYLWFIGVDPNSQNKGIGTKLMSEIINESHLKKKPLYLETSSIKNISWYQKFGLEIYNELNLSYNLFFLRNKLK